MDRKTRQQHDSLARFLEYVLGKAPDEFGLVLDSEGWIPIKQLVQASSQTEEWRGVGRNRIFDLRWALPENAFEIEDKRVRLEPGHPAALKRPQRESLPAPSILYYGSRRKPYRVYLSEGIQARAGEEIVLAREAEMALRIASRRDPKPILVEVSTRVAMELGTRFQSYGQNLFVTDWLSQEALSGPRLKEEKPGLKKKKKPVEKDSQQAPHPDSFHPRPWNPAQDTLLSRDPEESRRKRREERSRKKVGWKEDSRRGRRKPPENNGYGQ